MRAGARPVWRKFTGILSLLIYLVSATPLSALSTALVAALDSDHRLSLASDGSVVRVILGHDSSNPRLAPAHEHCLASRLLVALARDNGPEPDHVISFRSGTSAATRTSAVEPRLIPLIAPLPSSRFSSILRSAPASPALPPDSPSPPQSVAIVRSTIFLI